MPNIGLPNQGNYDKESEDVLRATEAVGVLLIVVEGNHGNGFSVSTLEPELIDRLPTLLRVVANGIEDQLLRTKNT